MQGLGNVRHPKRKKTPLELDVMLNHLCHAELVEAWHYDNNILRQAQDDIGKFRMMRSDAA